MGDRAMSNTDDLYEILQVHHAAEPEVVEAAFNRLAFKYHPDRNNSSQQAEEIMKALNRAHDILKDPAKRAAYDRQRGSQRRNTAKEPQGRSRAWDESKRDDDISNMPYGERVSQLFRVVRFADTEKARAIISSGVDVNTREGNRGWTPLHVATLEGHLQTSLLLVMAGTSVNIRDYNGYTPLHVAAANDNLVIAQMLTAHGADINVKDKDGITPLYSAAEAGNLRVVQMLAAHGADINAKAGGFPRRCMLRLSMATRR